MQQWEYLEVIIQGHNSPIHRAKNCLIWSSDGEYREAKLPTQEAIAWFHRLGEQGWQMIDSRGSLLSQRYLNEFGAWLQRPKE